MAKKLNTMTVQRTVQLTPHMVRVYLGGPGFDEFTSVDDTDMYVKILLPAAGVQYPEPFDLDRIREDFGPEQQPVLRTYTVRRVDTAAREIVIDFVVHGTEGLAGPWAATARPGEVVRFLGPGSSYRPRSDVDWHLLGSDEAGLPGLAAALESMPDGTVVKAFIEVAGPEDYVDLVAPDTAEITWLHRGGSSDEAGDDKTGANAPLVAAVKETEWLPGTVHVFIHGEAEAVMHNLRAYIRKDRGVPATHASISGYWRRGRTEEGFRQWKAQLTAREAAGSVV
ncbi:NADPH-dependent ferric siderophore reductase [Williamsia muralis]|uniref:NADPH-dependent ferric siderophore reductase n=1 Tax=Williamsia marianensis TaxID=85044 RepID=A0A495K9Z3_WILMA|nr:siderophore-interacting protein [Williamsia muralis]RKR97458.1 NADPH-dependent ferric siderophore reductase [Williamsia muralis]